MGTEHHICMLQDSEQVLLESMAVLWQQGESLLLTTFDLLSTSIYVSSDNATEQGMPTLTPPCTA